MTTKIVCGVVAIGVAVPGIGQELRPWSADPRVVEEQTEQRPEFNYHESKVPQYELPDPLRMSDGVEVTSAEMWDVRRRPELLELFRDQVYGRRPATNYSVSFQQESEVLDAFDGSATARSMVVTVMIGARSFDFPFVVFIPNEAPAKVPAVVHINNRYFVALETVLESHDPFWPVRTLIERGYATASFHTSNVDPDDADGYAEGIRSFFADGGPPEDDAWRALSAWGWGASRVLDYLETLEVIDANRVAVSGHSRGGKASLWAASEDTRFAVVYSNNSVGGGGALSRRRYGETVARINDAFPHWFCKRFWKYGGREDELPVDQHELITLIAPRAVYVASADVDLWADPKGEYASLLAAGPVFKLHGMQAITDPEMPALGQPRHVGRTGYHIRTGGHGLGDESWGYFLDFADSHLKH